MNERPLKVSDSTTNAEFSTLVEILRWRALNHPDQKAYTFLSDREEEHSLTYAELDRQARAIGAMLQKLNATGERILLLYPSGLEYIAAFFGCLYAGAIAVPAYPPRLNRSIERLWSIVADAQARFVLTTSQVLSKSQRSFSLVAGFQELQWFVTDRESINGNEVAWQRPQITESTLAFLQYTSGSTAAPKGVMVSHSNLISNHRMLQSTMAHPPESPFVSWLPLFHDMGLILKMLQALYMGSPCILFPSSVFIRSPFSWLQTISLHQAYSSGAPNFAYDLCVQKITPQQRDTLDLSTWKVAFCGAEPVRYQTLLKFAEYFAPCGFRAEALRPAYGLAEATLFVTGHPREQAPVVRLLKKEALEHHQAIITAAMDRNSVECTSCGSTELDARVVIVDPKTCTLSSPGAVGEVWVAGSHVAQGYWKRREETEKTFHAFIQDTQEGPFLRTGDLGFISEGSLFITGRLKDLIIIRGQNYYPQDIENTAELSHSSLKRDASAAFSIEVAGKERVILVMEIDRQYRYQAPQEIFSSIRQAILEKHDLHIDTIVLIKPGSILKTSSGKIQRRACRKAFLEQSLAILFADLSQAVKDLLGQQHDREVMPIMQPVQSTMVQSPLEIVAAKGHSLTSNLQNRVKYTATSNYSENKDMQFSLLYFSSNASDVTENKYELLLAGAKFADQHDFTAVWVPERHFHPFGGLYPNPSVLASALAVTTQRIRLRAGSVVLPMHHPVRVAEEWSVVDNLSSGRVDLAFAIGWNPNDFVLAPTQYEKRKDILFSGIEMFQKLWHGDEILLPNGLGKETAIKIYPLPVQSALTPWITCTGSPERFREAGAMGANVLTALLFQSQEELAEKIHAYRLARAQHGHDPATGHVTLMLHTFIGEDMDEVRQTVRPAFIAYLKSSVDLWRNGMQKLNDLMPQEQEQVLSYAFERYFQTHALFGTPQTASKKVEELSAIGVNEIACLIDFGIDVDTVMDSLHFLNSLRKRSRKRGTLPKKHVLEPKNIVSLQKAQRQQITIEITKNTEESKSTFCQSPILQVYSELEKDHNEQRVTCIEPDQSFFQQLFLAPLSQQLILLEQYLQQQIAQVLERPTQEISSVLNIRSLGLDSLMIMSIVNNCQRDLLITLDAGQFYEQTSFRSLALYIAEEFRRAHPAEKKDTPIRSVRPLVQRQEQPTIIPASFAQQRLWFLHQLQPNATAYNVLILLEIKGDLVVDALEWSLKEIIRRHESLRTSLILHEGRPVQIINQTIEFQLSQISLNYLPAEARELEVHRLARQESQCPFDLAQGSLIRAKLLLINPKCYVLLLSCHHVVMDGWSRGILLRELQTLYRSHIAGLPSPLEELPIQYADFTLWQRQWLSSLTDPETLPMCAEQENHTLNSKSRYTLFEKQLLYWKTQLAGPLPLLALPTDHPRPAVQTFHGAHLAIQLPEALMDDLKTLSKREGVTLFMTLLASFQVLLARYSGQEDILVGTPIAGRNQPEIEPLIGFFVNTLVLRTDLSGNPTFEQVLHRIRQICLGAYAHQEVPFEQVVDTVHPIRDLSRHPLFQVMFVLEEASWWLNAKLPGVSLQQLPTESGTSIFDLTCSITSQGTGEIEYNTDLFKPQTITRLIDHWQTLLEGIITDPQTRLSDLPLLTAAELEQLLVEWNATQADYPREVCVHHLFEQQVERTPDAVALVYEEQQLTYGQLNRRANQLAHYLQKLGVRSEVLVGICMERSLEMVIGLLGVLKAGGAYVPLDPSYPKERLAFMVQDAHIWILLTEQRFHEHFPLFQAQVVVQEQVWARLTCESDQNPMSTVSEQNLGYVIYTSGSTGNPKGVAISQGALLNLVNWHQQAYHVTPQDRATQVASLAFDAAVWEIWPYLLAGATLLLANEDLRSSPSQLGDWMRVQAVTLSFLPTPLAEQAVREAWPTDGTLRGLLTGGDKLHRLARSALPCELINHYGPTENTVVTTCASVRPGMAIDPPIGRPIANTQVYVLDRQMQPVPLGVTGELSLGGLGLARGYFNHPDLTAEHFVPHPWSQQPGARLYRTGDLARYRSDGNLEFVGRKDQQVKIRGYRIELGEIEAALRKQQGIREAVVVVREDVPGEKQLVAYVVGSQELTTTELRCFLQEKLPAYMIPSQFLLVDEMPLTPNGKLDRKALPAPQEWCGQAEKEQQGARTGIEEVLVDLWSQVLGRAQVRIHDTFFELGGHSLLATQLLARVRAVLGVELAVQVVFEAPTVAAFAQRVEQALRKGEGTQIPALVARARPEVLPLSFAQQRLWFLDQLEPGSTTYLVPWALRISGKIAVHALQGSLQELISRHESLRTTFQEQDGQPVQLIHLAGPSRLPVIDLQGLEAVQREQAAQRLASQERQHPCDLTTGPLLRTALLRLEQQEHVLLLTLHHIITDGWSNGVLMHELTTLYQAFVSGEPSPLVPLPLQYADYALWQREWLQGETLEASLSYWRSQLAGIAPLELPTDHPRPPVQAYRGASQELQLSPILSEQLVALSEQQNVTLFMLLLAAFQVLLARYTGQRDIAVGSPIANRRHAEIEGVIGFFVNTLVLRTDLSGDPTFDLVLQRVREVCLGAYAHQDLPFEKVVEELEPERDLSHAPLFQVMLVLQNTPRELGELAGVTVKSLSAESQISKFDLTLSMEETEQGLRCWLEYNTDLFEARTIVRMLSHWQTLLEGVVHNPQAQVSDVPLLTATEREQQLVQWNTTRTQYPQDLCVHHLFEQQVERTPDAVALVFEDKVLTYETLNRRANQLAHHLQMLGVGPEALVGICMERSLEMVIALLGVLKAGGAYVPLDPSFPQERFISLIEDCQPVVVLTQEHLRSRLPLMEALSLDTQWEERVSGAYMSNPNKSTSLEHLAYVIYTSGSTGKPKGVMNIHSGLSNRLHWMQQAYQLTARDCVLQKTPFSFDVSVWEFFWPLFTGARLVVAIAGGHQDPAYLQWLIVEQGVTALHFVPSMLQVFLQQSGLQECRSLRHVFSSGEVLTAELQACFFRHFSNEVSLQNLYGPTEAAIDVTSWQCQPEASSWVVPIGRPIANIQIYILDTTMRLVPIGVIGELYIAGVGLARGYSGRADLTAEKFLANPFAQQEGERLYRTGDLARYRSDGAIEYVGRRDQQVKIRGYRIELGEIEAVLGSHPAVQEGVILAREDVAGEKRLVAYVVGSQDLTEAQLRNFLQEKLPTYMIPSQFLLVDAMPLTPNGKLDRKALPAPQQWHREVDEGQQGARTPIEEVLVGLWSKVLGYPQVGTHDHFFELGGHSLLATQLLARVRAVLGVELPVRAVFEAPTVAEFARRVEQALRKGEGIQMPPLVARAARPEVLPLSFAQQRLWFLDQFEPDSPTYLVPSAVRIDGNIDVPALQGSLQELISRHECLRTTFQERDGQPVQIIHPVGPHPLSVIDLQGLAEEEREQQVRQLASQERGHPCDLATGPLLRTMLLRLEQEEHVLLLTLHHIITDGWSNGVLMRELTLLYQAKLRGQPSPLAPLPLHYADYALWQREWLQGEVLQAQLTYWRSQLAGIALLELPTDHPRPPVQTYRGASQELQLSSVLSEQLVALSERQNITLFMLLLAAFQVLLARYTGQRDIAVGSPIANRRHAEIEGVIGFFVNALVLRTNLSGDPTFDLVLRRVREVCLGAYAHQDLPFEKVVEELVPERDLSRSPLFQVMLVFQNAPQARADLAGVRVEPWNAETITSKFDLTLSITQTDQGLSCALEYNRDLFEPETIIRMLSHWQTVLAGVVHNPQVRLSAVPLLTEAERVLMLEKWNATQREYPQELCVHELFEQQVERTPDAVALVFEEQQLTYGQLNRRANQLTHHLQMLGVGPEVLVGICMDRSIEMVIAMLGVLKAGGAYVPLDPTYPQERLAFLVTDSGVQVVLIHSLLKPEWLLSHKLQILDLGRQWEAMSAHRQENWQGSVVSENVAYVIYTSGSTGKPKGTMVRHRNVVNFLTGMDERLGSQVSGSWLAVTSICFDISVLELLWTLTRGLQVVIHAQESERLQSPGKMASQETMLQEIQRQGITHLQCTPSQASLLFAEPDQLSALASLQTLLLGGEALPMALVKQLETVLVGDLYNMYGPTETTIWSTMQRVEKGATTVSIGRPIVNTRVSILDQHWQVVPIGGAGELFLGGKGVVRGYWNHPELTAESFLPDPWSQEAGAVMYRTGDRARYLPDGSIEFLGRMDQQVKLRGYRIELGEIEAVLCSHPGVREGVVQVREDVPGDKRLVAYVVGSQDLTEARLRSFLQEQLPAYMLPSQFLLLDAMPLTPNGKLDRLALPAPQQWHGQAQEGQQGTRTGIEELLVDLWSQVLGHSQVGIHETFFELGGHSLLVTQLLARVRDILGVELPVRAVFEASTVTEFAQRVEQALRKGEGTPRPPLVARVRPEVLPLSFAQQRLWFLDQLESGSTAYLLPNVLRFLGSLNTRAFERSLEELLHRHEILRTTFVAHAGQPVQVIHPAKRYCLPVIDLQGIREHEKNRLVEQLAEQEVRRPCDLAEGPLLRVYMFRLQQQDHRVFVTLHHIITDGWSSGVLVRELSTLYQAFIMEQCSPLEPLPLQYADYTLWQQQWLQGEILTSLLNYWTKQLRGASPLKLPTDRPRTARVSNHGAIHTFKLPSSLYQSLMALSHQENVTLFMTLLAAFQVLLHRYTGMQDIVIGTDVANRTSTETEKIIGFFVNLLVLRVQLSDQETFRELLKSVRTTVLNAYAHQDLPFEKLIDSLQLERNGKQVPLVNVLFVLQNMTQQVFELPGLTVSSIGTQAHTAKFDIAMFLTEEAQELIGYVNYRTDLFQPDSIARLVHHFKVLLQSIVTSPDVIISMLEMITEDEKQRESVLDSKKHEKYAGKLKSAKRIKLPLSPED